MHGIASRPGHRSFAHPCEVVTAVAQLHPIHHRSAIAICGASGAIRTVEYEAYRPELREKMVKPQILAQVTATFGHAKVFLLIRPRGFEHLARGSYRRTRIGMRLADRRIRFPKSGKTWFDIVANVSAAKPTNAAAH